MALAHEPLQLSLAFRCHTGRWLTVETLVKNPFNANAPSVKKKQIFFLEKHGETTVRIRTHLGNYLLGAQNGTLQLGEAANPDAVFEILPQADGKWALKTVWGTYMGGTSENIACSSKDLKKADCLWTVQLAIHPQVAIYNEQRKRYVHLSGDRLTTDEDVPWGHDAMIFLEFFESGFYGLVTSDGRYLSYSGALAKIPSADTNFILEFRGGHIAFRSTKGLFLTAVGGEGALKASKDAAGGVLTSNELFLLEDSQPQIKLTANIEKKGARKVSIKLGIELNAGQVETTDTEMFQMENRGGVWYFITCQRSFWSMKADGTIHADAKVRTQSEEFHIDWNGAFMNIRASNGKYFTVRPNGQLVANADSPPDLFTYELVNRPKLILRGDNGYIGNAAGGLITCSSSRPHVFDMSVQKGECFIKNSEGKGWRVADDKSKGHSDAPQSEKFYLVFDKDSRLAVQHVDAAGNKTYMTARPDGYVDFSSTKLAPSCLWEF